MLFKGQILRVVFLRLGRLIGDDKMEITKTENKRYRQLTYDGKKFLLDMDSNKLTWLFPFVVWFLPIRGYEDMTLPPEKKKQQSKGASIILFSSVLSGILVRMTNKGFGDLSVFDNYRHITMSLIIVSMGIVLFIRYYFRYKNNLVSVNDRGFTKVRIVINTTPDKIKYMYKLCIATSIAHGMVIALIYTFLTSYPNIIMLLPILIIEYFMLIVNTTILQPEKGYTIEVSQKK